MRWVDDIKSNKQGKVVVIIVALIAAWIVGFFVLQMSEVIHLLLVTAIVMVVFVLIKDYRDQNFNF